MKDVEDGRDCGSQRFDITDIDTRLRRFGELTAAQLFVYRAVKLSNIATRVVGP